MLRSLFLLLLIPANVLSFQIDSEEYSNFDMGQLVRGDGKVLFSSGWYFNGSTDYVYSIPAADDSDWVGVPSTLNNHFT